MKNTVLYIKFILISFALITAVGCKKEEDKETADKQYYYDPKIPFGNIDLNTAKIKNVENLTADASVLNKIKLKWRIPALYTTLPHKVMIYKRREAPAGFDIICPKPAASQTSLCPADEANGAQIFLYKELQASELLDQNELDENGDEINNVDLDMNYSYWVFLKVNDKDWSNGVRINVRSKSKGSSFELPPPAKFWEFKRWSLGYDPISNGTVNFLQSMQPGKALPGDIKGGISLAYSGNVLYFADTDNNRVVIYARSGALSCEQFTDEFEKSACLLQYIGSPMVATNIIGQSAPDSTYPCGGPYEKILAAGGNDDGICDAGETCENNPLPQNECLTKPRKVSVVGPRLFISDSGNNRIVVHNNLPTNGCITDNGSGQVTPRDCTPDWVIGKAGLLDTNTYNLGTSGNAILKDPTDVVANDGKLYIADTGHNRIVKIDNYFNRDMFNCTPDTWTTPLCDFDAVLGQADFYTDFSFGSMVASNPAIIVQSGLKDTIDPQYENILKRYFKKPNRIVFNQDGKLLIGANEEFANPNSIGGKSSVHSRILIFNENPIADITSTCNPATFETGECDADDVIGQAQFNKLATVSDGSPASYNQLQEGLFSLDDFDLISVPSDIEDEPNKEILIGVSSVTNEVYFWDNWKNKTVDGYPKTSKAIDPQAAPHPTTGQLMPDLKNICAVRGSVESTNIYITDCEGNRVHEIQAADYVVNPGGI